VRQKYLIIKQLMIAHNLKGRCYPSEVVAPHGFPYLDAAHVTEPVRSARSRPPVPGLWIRPFGRGGPARLASYEGLCVLRTGAGRRRSYRRGKQ